jgi:hypothetical protein
MSKSNSKKNTQPAVEPVEAMSEAKPIVSKKESKKEIRGDRPRSGLLGVSSQGAAIFSPGSHPRAIRQRLIDEAKKTEVESPEKKI